MGFILSCALVVLGNLIISCSSNSKKRISIEESTMARNESARPNPAVYGPENMWIDRAWEQEPYQKWNFYFKHCSLISRNPFPMTDKYSCTGPD
jgi:hypothetical protein